MSILLAALAGASYEPPNLKCGSTCVFDSSDAEHRYAGTVVSPTGMLLPLANVTLSHGAACSPTTQLTNSSGAFSFSCASPLPAQAPLPTAAL